MKKLTKISFAILALAGVIGIGAAGVSAQTNPTKNTANNHYGQGRGQGYQRSLETRAQVFGISVDELKEALKTKTMSQIAVDEGMDQDIFRAKMTEMAKTRMAERDLSEEEIAERMEEREARQAENQASCDGFGSGTGKRMGGYSRNR